MKTLKTLLMSIPIFGVLMLIAMWTFAILATLYGLYLAFSVSFLLGVVVLFVEPTPFIIGLVMIFFHKNLAQTLLDFFNK